MRPIVLALLIAFPGLGCGAGAPPRTASLVPAADALVAALDHAHASHPTAAAYAIDDVVESGKRRISVWMLDADDVHGVHFDPRHGAVSLDETFPVAEEARALVPMLELALRERDAPLARGVRFMVERYRDHHLRGVELEMHGSALVLEALLGAETTEAVHVHDPDDGRYLMTEMGVPPAEVSDGT